MPLQHSYDNFILDALLGDDHSVDMPATVYVGLSGTAPTPTGTGITEPSVGGYARISVANTGSAPGTNWPDAVAQVKSNGVILTFPAVTGDWVTTVGYWLIADSLTLTGAHIITYGPLTAPVTVHNGDAAPFFAVGQLQITAA